MKDTSVIIKTIPKVSAPYSQGRILLVTGILFLLISFSGCYYKEDVSGNMPLPGTQAEDLLLKRLAILPFEVKVPDDENTSSAYCPICGTVFQTDRSPQKGDIFLEEVVAEHLRENKQLMIVDAGSSAEAYRRIAASSALPLEAMVRQIGDELGVDGVLIGYIFRYRERVGTWYSVDKPASVAFDLHLLNASTGRVIWHASFDRTQSSLMENLSQLSSVFTWGVKWFSAKELAEQGVVEILKSFPRPK